MQRLLPWKEQDKVGGKTNWGRMKEVVAMIREHSPQSEIILGGYGTVLSDEALAPYADHICREEGVGFMRRLLGEPGQVDLGRVGLPPPRPLIALKSPP